MKKSQKWKNKLKKIMYGPKRKPKKKFRINCVIKLVMPKYQVNLSDQIQNWEVG